LSFIDERQVLTVIQPMLHLHECIELAPVESAAEPLHSVGDSVVVEESAVEPLHSTDDPATAESVAEPLQSVADSDAAADAPIETSYS
jgi:cephalosporin hydroxylase